MLRKTYLIDGYNALNTIDSLRAIMRKDLAGARDNLINSIIELTAYEGSEAIVVFDGRAEGLPDRSFYNRGSVEVVFTRKDETADELIERIAFSMEKEVVISLVTSDYLQQKTAFSKNVLRIPPRELWEVIGKTGEEIAEASLERKGRRRKIEDELDDDVKEILEKMRRGII